MPIAARRSKAWCEPCRPTSTASRSGCRRNREDAEDATQEILVRIVTRLSQFDFRSRLKTWAYRVAVNFILDVKKSAGEKLFAALTERLNPLFEKRPLAISFEMRELDPELSFKKNNLHQRSTSP